MTEPENRIGLEITSTQASTILNALWNKASEINHYLRSFPADGPTETDSCCTAHLSRFGEQIRMRDALREQKTQVRELIDRLEVLQVAGAAVGTAQEGTTSIEPSSVTLVYRSVAGEPHEQPLADITGCGTLIDPETGDDLELVAALISPRALASGPDRAV